MVRINLRNWVESVYVQIGSLVATYGLFASTYIILSITIGERFVPIAIFNNFAHLITLGGLCSLMLATMTPYRRIWMLYSLPAALAFVVWYGPLFLPNTNTEPESDITNLTVATYNTAGEWMNYDDLFNVMLALDADIIGIPEAPGEFRVLPELTKRHYPYQLQEGNLALLSRYPIERNSVRVVRNEELGRVEFLAATVTVNDQPTSIYVFHPVRPVVRLRPFYYNQEPRAESVRQLAEEIRRDVYPVVLLCDCNFAYRTDDYRIISTLLIDSWRARGFGFGFTAPAQNPNLPIGRSDLIWHSDEFTTTAIQVWPDSATSDHFPVVASLTFPADSTNE